MLPEQNQHVKNKPRKTHQDKKQAGNQPEICQSEVGLMTQNGSHFSSKMGNLGQTLKFQFRATTT